MGALLGECLGSRQVGCAVPAPVLQPLFFLLIYLFNWRLMTTLWPCLERPLQVSVTCSSANSSRPGGGESSPLPTLGMWDRPLLISTSPPCAFANIPFTEPLSGIHLKCPCFLLGPTVTTPAPCHKRRQTLSPAAERSFQSVSQTESTLRSDPQTASSHTQSHSQSPSAALRGPGWPPVSSFLLGPQVRP